MVRWFPSIHSACVFLLAPSPCLFTSAALPVFAAALVILRHRATPLDIFNFFENYAVIAESLQLGVDALGRPSGEAWLTFSSSDEALRAVRKRNRHYLGNRYLELSLT
jgi:hypothetical protein